MMTNWFGYPQHPDAHPERPWWRVFDMRLNSSGQEIAWRRTDGMLATMLEVESAIIDVLAIKDAEHPLPAPPPLCGQVWVDPRTEKHFMVQAVSAGVAILQVPNLTHGMWELVTVWVYPEHWPIKHVVLVAGPGAPWAPPNYKEL